MEAQKPHAVQDALMDLVDDLVLHFAVGHVPPPGQHVRLGQHLVGQAVFRFVQRGRSGLDVRLGVQEIGDYRVHSVGVDLFARVQLLLVPSLIPDRHSNRVSHRFAPCATSVMETAAGGPPASQRRAGLYAQPMRCQTQALKPHVPPSPAGSCRRPSSFSPKTVALNL